MRSRNRSRLLASQGLVALAGLAACSLAQAHWVYISNEKDDTVTVIDSETYEVVKTLEVGFRPRGITLSKDFSRMYICASDSDAVQVFDVATDKILHDLPSSAWCWRWD